MLRDNLQLVTYKIYKINARKTKKTEIEEDVTGGVSKLKEYLQSERSVKQKDIKL